MATCTFTNTILKRLVFNFDLDEKTMLRKPARKLISSHSLVFNNSKKNEENGVSMISKKVASSSSISSLGEITANLGPNGPETSNVVMPSVIQKWIVELWSGRLYSRSISVILNASILINSGAFFMLIIIATIALSFLKLLLQKPPLIWKWQRQQHISTVNGQECQVKFEEPPLRPHLGGNQMRKTRNTTSGGSACKWVLEFLWPTDVQDIEVFCFILAILLAFGLLSQLYCYMSQMLFPKNDIE